LLFVGQILLKKQNAYLNSYPASLLITSFTPTSGPAGTVVTVSGRGLHCVSRITVGGAAATQITTTIDNQTSLSFTVPADAVTGVVTLTSSAGSASSSERFTVTIPAPTISGFSPTSGAPGTVITVTGTNLTGATQVTIGGVAAQFTVNRDGSVSVTVPSGAVTGVISITTGGGTATSGRTTFTVLAAAPTISSFSPSSGTANSTITLQGTNLTGTTQVAVGGVGASFTVNRDGSLTITVPSGTQGGVIVVTTPGGSATSSTAFTVVQPAPTITGFSPLSGNPNSSITLQGTNLTGATRVTVGGVAASFTVVGSGAITIVVPSGAQTGVITVTTPGGTASSSQTFRVIPTSVRDAAPSRFQARLFPQPAFTTGEITLEYSLSGISDVRVEVVNVLGRSLQSHELGTQSSGTHTFAVQLPNVSAGAYFVRLSANGVTAMLPMQIIR
jgi:type IV pilus biogenesis protein CpaD/CtpE